MKRRRFILALAAVATSPPILAQPAPPFRIGWISNDRAGRTPFFNSFRGGMRDLGYAEGTNLIIDARWGEGSLERLQQLARELVQSRPDVIVTQGPAILAALAAGATMPVVFGFSGDPVEAGFVDSLARPGRNCTGVSFLSLELVGKRMELLKEAIPGLKRVAIIANPGHAGQQSELRASQTAGGALGIALAYFQVRSEAELDEALASVPKSRSEALVVFPDAFIMGFSSRIAAVAAETRIPAISGWAQFAQAGNLMSYGPNLRDCFRRLATFVDRIRKGARPADLPVELPTTVELVVNLKAAKALGVTMPQSLLVRADEVIQ